MYNLIDAALRTILETAKRSYSFAYESARPPRRVEAITRSKDTNFDDVLCDGLLHQTRSLFLGNWTKSAGNSTVSERPL